MGDADNTQNRMSVQEIEEWMDDALNEMDDGMSSLFSIMNILNTRVNQISSEIAIWRVFRNCFAAFNLFVIPIILCIGIAYGTAGGVEPGSDMEDFLQLTIIFLMYVAGCIGFPLYLFTVWAAYSADKGTGSVNEEGEIAEGRIAGGLEEEDSVITLRTVTEGSLARISEFVNQSMRDTFRSSLARRVSQAAEVDEAATRRADVVNPGDKEMLENHNLEENTETNQKLMDLDFSTSSPDYLSEVLCSEMFQKSEMLDSGGVKVIILNTSQDLCVEVEKESDIKSKPSEGGALRDILIEAKGD